jgi:4-hydroxy-2-oxoheptanedioate aldolase
MTPNAVRAAHERGEPAVGGWCSIPSSLAAEQLARAGFPWVVIDLQHGGATWGSELISLTQALTLGGADTLIRVGGNDPTTIMRALDVGAVGVIVPMIDTPEQALAVASAMRYPPVGTRSYGPTRARYAGIEQANADVLCLPMIETALGHENLEAIAAAPGVDGLFVGPVDLALSLGHGLDLTMRHPVVDETIERAVRATAGHGGFVATVARDADHARSLLDRGVRMLTVGSDRTYMAAGAAAVREAFS